VLLTEFDISRLARAAGLAERDWIEQFAELASHRAGLSLRENPDGACVFLKGDRCAVYEARPLQCRDYPHRWNTRRLCPGWHSGWLVDD
jgi:uncharacterized protein